jgi:hypothetical protein
MFRGRKALTQVLMTISSMAGKAYEEVSKEKKTPNTLQQRPHTPYTVWEPKSARAARMPQPQPGSDEAAISMILGGGAALAAADGSGGGPGGRRGAVVGFAFGHKLDELLVRAREEVAKLSLFTNDLLTYKNYWHDTAYVLTRTHTGVQACVPRHV